MFSVYTYVCVGIWSAIYTGFWKFFEAFRQIDRPRTADEFFVRIFCIEK